MSLCYNFQVGTEYTEYLYQTWAGDNFRDVKEEDEEVNQVIEEIDDTTELLKRKSTNFNLYSTQGSITDKLKSDSAKDDQGITDTRYLPNSLDPHHTVYLCSDDGTKGCYNKEAKIRVDLEKYIAQAKSLTTGEYNCQPLHAL